MARKLTDPQRAGLRNLSKLPDGWYGVRRHLGSIVTARALERRGLVEVRWDPDNYTWRTRLTEAGRAAI